MSQAILDDLTAMLTDPTHHDKNTIYSYVILVLTHPEYKLHREPIRKLAFESSIFTPKQRETIQKPYRPTGIRSPDGEI